MEKKLGPIEFLHMKMMIYVVGKSICPNGIGKVFVEDYLRNMLYEKRSTNDTY